MTLRIDDKLGLVAAYETPDHKAVEEDVFNSTPTAKRYAVFVDGAFAFGSSRAVGDRVKAAVKLGATVDVLDRETMTVMRLDGKK